MKILNSEKEDYHIHSLNYSEALNTIDEIVIFAGKIGMKKIAITDHSFATLQSLKIAKKCLRLMVRRWNNVHNDVEVIFGVEADLLNADGDICAYVSEDEKQWATAEENFIILSYHSNVFKGNKEDVVKGFIKAIEKYHDKINFIGHVCSGLTSEEALRVINEANKYKIPLELNGKYFKKNPEQWDILLENADSIYINSDGHTLSEIRDLRKDALDLLKDKGYEVDK